MNARHSRRVQVPPQTGLAWRGSSRRWQREIDTTGFRLSSCMSRSAVLGLPASPFRRRRRLGPHPPPGRGDGRGGRGGPLLSSPSRLQTSWASARSISLACLT
jgi:hypothetical protein